jgi:hypothetical protein
VEQKLGAISIALVGELRAITCVEFLARILSRKLEDVLSSEGSCSTHLFSSSRFSCARLMTESKLWSNRILDARKSLRDSSTSLNRSSRSIWQKSHACIPAALSSYAGIMLLAWTIFSEDERGKVISTTE